MGPESETQRELTFGEKSVGLTFNPSAIKEVDDIKAAGANFIDVICGHKGEKVNGDAFKQDAEAAAMRKLAQRAAQEAQMWAVKAATWGK